MLELEPDSTIEGLHLRDSIGDVHVIHICFRCQTIEAPHGVFPRVMWARENFGSAP